jgi:hypothetical protein
MYLHDALLLMLCSRLDGRDGISKALATRWAEGDKSLASLFQQLYLDSQHTLAYFYDARPTIVYSRLDESDDISKALTTRAAKDELLVTIIKTLQSKLPAHLSALVLAGCWLRLSLRLECIC